MEFNWQWVGWDVGTMRTIGAILIKNALIECAHALREIALVAEPLEVRLRKPLDAHRARLVQRTPAVPYFAIAQSQQTSHGTFVRIPLLRHFQSISKNMHSIVLSIFHIVLY